MTNEPKRYIPEGRAELTMEEIGNTYVGPNDRFVVSLVVGYSPEDGVTSPLYALKAALELIGVEGYDTHWYVHDRENNITRQFEQHEAEDSEECSQDGCKETVSRDEPYFATPCGTWCDEHMRGHVEGCGVCADEFPEAK
jgi:hypothetical protein